MMTPAGFEHGRIAMRLGWRIGRYVEEHDLGEVLAAETGFTLERDPDTVRAPDVAFVRKERVPPSSERRRFAELGPDLVVEVVSPGDRAAAIEEKVQDYLHAGVRLIWVVYPDTKSVTEYRPATQAKSFGLEDELQGYDVLPGFICPVAQLFS